ncbi:MAG TPA: hypothetical protein VG738_12225 [Chitinophagaceae bacterium]|nr:hypothetical protein [Chitinophagaceae bacterium]
MKRSLRKIEKEVKQYKAEVDKVIASEKSPAPKAGAMAPMEAMAIPGMVGGHGPAIVPLAVSDPTSQQLTPLLLAQSLKLYLNDPNFVAQGTEYGFPATTAFGLGTLLFDPSLYPGLDAIPMRAALYSAGFSQADVDAAIAQLYGTDVQFTVQANITWQSTGVTVGPGAIAITYLSGEWTANPDTGLVNAAGNPNYIGKEGYALPGANEGALIGSVNGTAFLVGFGANVPQGLTGLLQLVINDDLSGIYGPGLTDNYGTVTVSIKSI